MRRSPHLSAGRAIVRAVVPATSGLTTGGVRGPPHDHGRARAACRARRSAAIVPSTATQRSPAAERGEHADLGVLEREHVAGRQLGDEPAVRRDVAVGLGLAVRHVFGRDDHVDGARDARRGERGLDLAARRARADRDRHVLAPPGAPRPAPRRDRRAVGGASAVAPVALGDHVRDAGMVVARARPGRSRGRTSPPARARTSRRRAGAPARRTAPGRSPARCARPATPCR